MDIQARKEAIRKLVEAMNRGCERAKEGRYAHEDCEEEKLAKAFEECEDLEVFAERVEAQGLHLGNIGEIQYWNRYQIEPASVEKLFGFGIWSKFTEDKREPNFISEITRADQKVLVNDYQNLAYTNFEELTADMFGLAFAEAGGTLEDNIPEEVWFVPEFVRGYLEYFSVEHSNDRECEDDESQEYIDCLKKLGEYIKRKLEVVNVKGEQEARNGRPLDNKLSDKSERGV